MRPWSNGLRTKRLGARDGGLPRKVAFHGCRTGPLKRDIESGEYPELDAFKDSSNALRSCRSGDRAHRRRRVLAAIAEFERDLIRDRVVAGMKRARAQGRRCGRPRVSAAS